MDKISVAPTVQKIKKEIQILRELMHSEMNRIRVVINTREEEMYNLIEEFFPYNFHIKFSLKFYLEQKSPKEVIYSYLPSNLAQYLNDCEKEGIIFYNDPIIVDLMDCDTIGYNCSPDANKDVTDVTLRYCYSDDFYSKIVEHPQWKEWRELVHL